MAIWEKLFSKITFKDYPDTSTPLNADNLNKMTDAIDGIDDRVVELNSNLPYQPITSVEQTFTIVDCINATPLNTIASYVYPNYDIPSDYPSDMDATYRAVVTVRKISNFAARLNIVSMQDDGSPDFVEGYYNNTTEKIFFWGTRYSKKISGIRNAYYTRLTSIQNVDTEWTAPKNGILRVTSRPNATGAFVSIKSIDSFSGHFIYIHTYFGVTNNSEIADVNVFEGQKVLISSKDLYSLSVSFIDFV